jgi:hypothetical protein
MLGTFGILGIIITREEIMSKDFEPIIIAFCCNF